MAKLNLRNGKATEVGKVRVDIPLDASDTVSGLSSMYYIYALRSDGVILRKVVSVYTVKDSYRKSGVRNDRHDSGYSTWKKVSDPTKATLDFLRTALERMYSDSPEGTPTDKAISGYVVREA